MKIEADILKAQITQVLLGYPELLGDDEGLRLDSLEGETDLKEILSKIVRLIGDDKASMTGLSAYAKTLMERHARFERRTEALRALAFQIMETANLKKIQLSEATLSIQSGSARVVLTDEAQLPDDYVRIKREADKTKIKSAIESGTQVPGATLSNSPPFLVVRTS